MPLLWISLSFGLGLVAAAYLRWTAAGWLCLAAAALALLPAARLRGFSLVSRGLRFLSTARARLFVAPALLVAFFFFGAWRMAISAPDLSGGHIAAVNDSGKYRIVAVVDTPPDLRDRSSLLRMQVETVAPLNADGTTGTEQPAHGLMMVVLPPGSTRQYGDRLALEGSPVTPPEDEEFSYRDYLARQNIYTYLAFPRTRLLDRGAGNPLLAAIYRLRDWALAKVLHLFPAPEGPLLAGILLGVESGIPDDLKRAFQDTGTAHVIAISGFNIAILAEIFSRLFGKIFTRGWALLAAIGAISVYTVLVGASPSVVRAAVMGSMSLLAGWLGRRSTAANSLAFTGMIMCLHNPHLLWDVSFQLSFGATLGLILYGERLQRGFEGLLQRRLPVDIARRIAAPVGEYLLMTLAAQLMTLPIVLYHFQRLSLSALITNPLILPAQPLVMLMGGAAVLLGAVSDPLAHAAAWIAWPLPAYTNRVVEWMARIPGGVLVTGEMGLGTTALMYTAALLPLWSPRLPARLKDLVSPALLAVGMGLMAAVLWRGAASLPDGKLHLLLMNIDGAQVVLLRAPAGETVLINGGPAARPLEDALGRRLSPFDHELDALLISDASGGAVSALPGIIERYPPRRSLWAVPPPDTRAADRLAAALIERGAPAQTLLEGMTLQVGAASVKVLAANEEGAALLIETGGFRVLLPGGIEPGELSRLAGSSLSVLALDTRDLKESSPRDWQAFSPQVTLMVSDDSAVSNALPGWVAVAHGGWVSVLSDGEKMWIERR